MILHFPCHFQDTQPYANQADAEPANTMAVLRRSLMSAIRNHRAAPAKPPLPSRRCTSRSLPQASLASAKNAMGTSSDIAKTEDLSFMPLTSTPAAQRSGELSGSHSLSAASKDAANNSPPPRQTSSAAASAKSADDGESDGRKEASTAVRALSPFVPRLLRSELAAAAPQLPSLAGLAGLQQLDMASIAKVGPSTELKYNCTHARIKPAIHPALCFRKAMQMASA